MKNSMIIAINFLSFKDTNETRTMHSKGDNKEIMIGNETDEIIQELFHSLLQKYEKRLRIINEG